jgi:hypothetical protein
LRNGNNKSFFSGLISKVTKTEPQTVSLGSIKPEVVAPLNIPPETNNAEYGSKTLDKIKQKKLNKDKKLASDNVDYEPVFK